MGCPFGRMEELRNLKTHERGYGGGSPRKPPDEIQRIDSLNLIGTKKN